MGGTRREILLCQFLHYCVSASISSACIMFTPHGPDSKAVFQFSLHPYWKAKVSVKLHFS